MYVKEEKGRKYFKCNECGKMYSFRSGRNTRFGMEDYCRDCGARYYPPLPSKKVTAMMKRVQKGWG